MAWVAMRRKANRGSLSIRYRVDRHAVEGNRIASFARTGKVKERDVIAIQIMPVLMVLNEALFAINCVFGRNELRHKSFLFIACTHKHDKWLDGIDVFFATGTTRSCALSLSSKRGEGPDFFDWVNGKSGVLA
jgi:hypothetical protein